MKQKLHALFYCLKATHWQHFNTIKLFTLFFFITSSFFSMATAQGTAVIRIVGTSSFCSTGAPINANIKVDVTGGTGPYTIVYRSNTGGATADFTVSNYTSGASIAVSQTSTTNYTLVSVTNSTGTAAAISGTAAITIFEPVLGTITHAACQNASGSVAISALPLTPWTIRASGGQILANRVGVTAFTLPLPVGINNFTITSSGAAPCTQSFSVTINPPAAPNAPILNASQLVCSQTSFDQNWTAVENAVGYELDVSSSPDFSTFLSGYQSKVLGNVTSEKVTGINPANTYYVRLRAKGQCAVSTNSVAAEVSPIVTTTYENGIWSNGLPDTNKHIVFNSSYTVDANMKGCSCQVNSGAAVTVNSGITLKLENGLNVQGSLTFEDDASLVQVNEAANTGNIVYKRKKYVSRYDLTYWSSPITTSEGFTMFDFSPNTLYDKFQYYDSNLSKWAINYNGTMIMIPGQGYNIRAPQNFDITTKSEFNGVFTGLPNNGNITASTISGKWNLIGNPYPSAINLMELYAANPTLGSVYFWSQSKPPAYDPNAGVFRYSSNDFISMNLTGSVKTYFGQELPLDTLIAATQGFLAKPGSGVINFTNAMRIENQNSQFFKTTNTSQTVKDRIWLNLTNTEGIFKQLLIGYIEGAVNGYDPNYDAVSQGANSFVDFYSVSGNSKATIQGRALPFQESDQVRLGYKSNIAGTLTISIDNGEGIFENQAVFLEDKLTDTFYNLTCGDYNFDTAIGTFNDRFMIHYTNADNKPALAAPIISESVISCNQTSYIQEWTAVKNAQHYKIDVASDVDFTMFLAGYQDKELGNVTSENITGIMPGTKYYVRLRAVNNCGTSLNSNVVTPKVVSTVYENGTWSNGIPDSSKEIVFNGDYTISSDMNGCSCLVKTGVSVVVNSGVTLKLENGLHVQGSLNFEDDASLVQVNEVANTGNIIYKRKTTVRRYDLTYWSSPITTPQGFTMYNFSPGTLGDKYYIYDANAGWVVNYNGTFTMDKGKGYSIRAPQYFDINVASEFVGIFTGIPNNGNIAANVVSSKWNLLGNPYPSAIDINELYLENPNLGSLYFWKPITFPNPEYGSDGYVPLNLTGSIKVLLANEISLSEIISAGQGFMVRPVSTTVNYTNKMRIAGRNSQFYKSTNSFAAVKNRIWLNLTNTSGEFKELLIGYVEGAVNTYDTNYDASTMRSGSNVDFYSMTGTSTTKLTIQGRALPFNENDVVPLGFKATAGTFTIEIERVEGIFIDQAIYLEDKMTNMYYNLKSANYTFTTAAGIFTDRFVLHYLNSSSTSKKVSTENIEIPVNEPIVSVNDNEIKIDSFAEKINQINIYDIKGSLLHTSSNVNSNNFSIDKSPFKKQVLIVKTTLQNGRISSSKIVL